MQIRAVAMLCALFVFCSSFCLEAQTQSHLYSASAQIAGSPYGSLPLSFEANQGQAGRAVRFLSKGRGYTAFLTGNGMILSLRPSEAAALHSPGSTAPQSPTVLQFSLIGATDNVSVSGEDPQPGKVNYFFGSNPSQWRTNVTTYGRIRYHNVYPGIDLIYYGNNRQLEYDFAVSPSANASQIQFQIQGAKSINLDANGNLVLDTGNGQLTFTTPTVYQEADGTRTPVRGRYILKDSTHIGFDLTGVDPAKPTVIDPVLVYGTFLGGSGDDEASSIAVDSGGNVYLTGYTDSTDFPLAVMGALPTGNPHVFVAKLDPSGSTLLYADYIGGNAYEQGSAISVDSAGEVYVTGSTASSNFPLVNPYQATYPGGYNGFLTKVSSDGSTLLYSTYFGGNGTDSPAAIVLDNSADILIAGSTSSTNLPTANAYQSTASANQGGHFGTYGFLTEFSPGGSSLVYSTYFAGNYNFSFACGSGFCWPSPYSAIAGLAVDSLDNAYVGGGTNTYNFPTTSGAYQTSINNPQNNLAGFLAKFNGSGTLIYSSYLDESSGISTTINAVAVDEAGSAYVTGGAFSDGTFPVTSTTICDPSVYFSACGFGFVTKFDSGATSLLYSTFLGPNNLSTPVAIALDSNRNAYVVGSTISEQYSLANGIEGFSTEGSQHQAFDYDVLLAEVDAQASSQLLATYIGGSGNNVGLSMALDATNNIYVTGSTDSIDFPVTQGSFQQVIGGNTDAFIVKIAPLSGAAVSVSPWSLDYPVQSLGSASTPQALLLRNMGSSALDISSITTPSGFEQTNDCGNSIPAAGTCTLSVIFDPIAAGTDSGNISIVDNAAGSPHLVSVIGVGTGPAVTLSVGSLTFPVIAVGTASAPNIVTVANSGDQSLDIASIEVSGDFSQTNNCPTLLAASGSCQIQVIFTPTVPGVRSGMLTLGDNAFSSPQTLTFTGTGEADIALSPGILSFAGQIIGTASPSQIVTLTNQTPSPFVVSKVSITGDFSGTNNCSTVAAGGTCVLNVGFAPSLSGIRAGTLTVTTSIGASASVGLSGTGVDFSLTSSVPSVTITSGATATYKMTLTPLAGAFTSAIQLSCSGQPTDATCNFSSNPVTPGTTAVTVTMTIATATTTSHLLPNGRVNNYLACAVLMPIQVLGLLGAFIGGITKRSKKLASSVVLTLIVAASLFTSACAGGTGIISGGNQTGTPAGTYNVSVAGVSGNLKHSVPVVLNIEQ
jgi:hypothetical protein